jgi:CRP/FNR family transcriptional regulator, dissimilatory nitrate respiration regulator
MPASLDPPLPDLALFEGINPPGRRILEMAPRRRFRRGVTMWTAGSVASGLLVVLSGRVRVVRAPAGRQYSVHTEGPGGTLGEVPFFAGGRYPATAITAEPTTCLVLDRATLARVLAADPELALRWLGKLADRVRHLVERLDRKTTRTVEQRVAELLLARHHASGGTPFMLAATQVEAAEELGTVREVIVRTLRKFRERRLVSAPRRGWYRARDAGKLQRIADVGPTPRAPTSRE